jgi:hypothetical protein
MDYTVRTQRWHMAGAAPMAAVLAAAAFFKGQAGFPATIWQLNRWAAGLLLVWWFLGIALTRRHPYPWVSGALQASRFATRILWGAAVALLVSSLSMLGAHSLYRLILLKQVAWLDMLSACGAILLGQAAGVMSLRVYSRPRPYMYGGTAMICAVIIFAALT